jgi:hypothetical protein
MSPTLLLRATLKHRQTVILKVNKAVVTQQTPRWQDVSGVRGLERREWQTRGSLGVNLTD